MNLTITVEIKFIVRNNENYCFGHDNRCYNSKTNKEVKQVIKSGCIGYNFNRKFYSINFLKKNNMLIKHSEDKCPF